MFFRNCAYATSGKKEALPEDDPQQDEPSDADDVQMPNKKVEEISVAIYEKDGVSVAVPTEEHGENHFIRDDEIVAEPFSVDKSFSIYDPIQWIKWRFPRFLFAALMLFETLDVISDCLQLHEVTMKFSKYNAPPYLVVSHLNRRYTVIWEKVTRYNNGEVNSTSDPLLGFTLAWDGAPSGVKFYAFHLHDVYEFDCLHTHASMSRTRKLHDRGSDYQSEEVCIPVNEVFSLKFPQPFPQNRGQGGVFTSRPGESAICPNNETAVFDEHSYRTFNGKFKQDPVFPHRVTVLSQNEENLNMLNYYKTDWTSKIMKPEQCSSMFGIYVATIVFFSFQCASIMLQIVVFTYRLRKKPPSSEDKKKSDEYRKDRVQAIVEFPLIGFYLGLHTLTDREWDMYAYIDYESGQPHPEYTTVSRICGFHNKHNFLYSHVWSNTGLWCRPPRDDDDDGDDKDDISIDVAKLKELKELLDSGVLTQAEFDAEKAKVLAGGNSVEYTMGDDDVPEFGDDYDDDDSDDNDDEKSSSPQHVTLGQKMFHTFLFILSPSFRDVFFGSSHVGLCIYYLMLPVFWLYSISIFSVYLLVWFFLITLAYGDKLLLSRIIFDLPNFALSLTYILVIEANVASILSCLFSGLLLAYYLSGTFINIYKDFMRPPTPQLFPIDDLYGKVTSCCEAFYLAFLIPFFILGPVWWVIIPAVALRAPYFYVSPDEMVRDENKEEVQGGKRRISKRRMGGKVSKKVAKEVTFKKLPSSKNKKGSSSKRSRK